MNELKHNAFLNSASHSPWVVRQVALETQQNAFLRVALTQQNAFYESVGNSASRFYGRSTGSNYWYFIKIESGLEFHNNLTRAKEPGPA
ncbi:hypothetical protein AYB34_16605 [Leptospira sp. ZV016]|nr:hypothetical protein AYB32_17325 [Leptospira kirschneri]KXZ29620.1 hypothetical protein AYB34_16605 [Leptospira sp. ZV016]